jgi:hypothetical protein
MEAVAARNASLDACHSDGPVLPLLVIAIVVQAVLLAFCVMAYRLTTGEEVAQENITVALLASPERVARSESSRTLR